MPRTLRPREDDLFVSCAPEVRASAWKAHQLVLSVMPDAVLVAENGNTTVHYSTGLKMADQVFYVAAHTAHVNLGLMGGSDLPDPEGIMEGTGKRLRHVKLRKPEDVDKPALRTLLETALEAHKETLAAR